MARARAIRRKVARARAIRRGIEQEEQWLGLEQ